MIIEAIYFFLPAYFANMMPVFVQKINFLKIPLDGGLTINKERILGDHKTIRGLIAGILGGILIAYLQSFHLFPSLEIVDYSQWFMMGLLQSIGALSGDAIKSFFKRQKQIPPGHPWIPYDQLDFIVGAILLILTFISIPIKIIIITLIITPFLHVIANRIGYLLKMRNIPW